LPPIDGSSLAVKLNDHELTAVTAYFRLRASLSPSSLCTGETAARAYTCIGFLAALYLLWAGTVRRVLLMAGTNSSDKHGYFSATVSSGYQLALLPAIFRDQINNANDDVNEWPIKIPRLITIKYIFMDKTTYFHC